MSPDAASQQNSKSLFCIFGDRKSIVGMFTALKFRDNFFGFSSSESASLKLHAAGLYQVFPSC
jgi:hypothetical protein